MSLPWGCSWCGETFGRRADRAQHEDVHEREERRDYESEGAAAHRDGVPLGANPWPAGTWPAIGWAAGWEQQSTRRRAA